MTSTSLYISFYVSLLKSLLYTVFGRLYTPQNPPSRDLSGQTAIVTGANSGIGLSIATALAKQGATVYLACRNLEKGDAAVGEVISRAGDRSQKRVFCWNLDVGDLESVRRFCERWKREGKKINMLVHNAGIAGPPLGGANKTTGGLDILYTTNFLGSFLMTHLLESRLTETAKVVFTSSTGSYSGRSVLQPSRAKGEFKTGSASAYGHTKTQQVLFALLLQRHFSSQGDKRTAHAFSPGFTSTPIFEKFHVEWKTWISNPLFSTLKLTEKWVAVDTDEGAKTGVWLASAGDGIFGGGYWEWMTRRTSLIEFMCGKMGQTAFRRACREQWARWEKDADLSWEVEF